MSYQLKVQQYKKGAMSDVERLAFEHELEDNANLREVYEAELLFEELIDFTGSPLTDETPTSGAVTNQVADNSIPSTSENASLFTRVGVGSLLLFGLLGFAYLNTTPPSPTIPAKASSLPPELIKEIPAFPIEALKPIKTKEVKDQVEKKPAVLQQPKKATKKIPPAVPYAENKKSIKSIPTPIIGHPKIVKNETSPSEAIASYSATSPLPQKQSIQNEVSASLTVAEKVQKADGMILETGFSVAATQSFSAEFSEHQSTIIQHGKDIIKSSEVINEGKSVTLSAAKAVVLQPGFEIKAGADFAAVIEEGSRD